MIWPAQYTLWSTCHLTLSHLYASPKKGYLKLVKCQELLGDPQSAIQAFSFAYGLAVDAEVLECIRDERSRL